TLDLSSLRTTKRRVVSVAADELVQRDHLAGQVFPLVIAPTVPDVDIVQWAAANRADIERDLLAYGAVLFRGFTVDSPERFEASARALSPELLRYVEGSSPRRRLTEYVYTSTEYPSSYTISMHNELSYAHKWPAKLFFCCLKAPNEAGETPLADGRQVLRRISPRVRDRFKSKGVRYVRNMHAGTGTGLSWHAVFDTTERDEVEKYCREGGIAFEWTPEGGLRTEQRRAAIQKHPKTAEEIWFCQVDQWHPTNLPEEVRRALLATTRTSDLPIYATYGDGSELEDEVLAEIRTAAA